MVDHSIGVPIFIDHSIMGSFDQIMIQYSPRDLLDHDRVHHQSDIVLEQFIVL